MSFLLMAKVIKDDIHDCYAKWLMVVLADYADEETHQCWPSIQRLVQRTEMARSTVLRKLDWLEENNFLSRKSGDSTKSNIYTIYPEVVSQRHHVVSERHPNLSKNLSDKKRMVLVTEDWQPSEELCLDINSKLKEDQDHEYETDQFRNYHASKGSKFVNIDLAYRGWCRRAAKWRAERGRASKAQGVKGSTRGRQKASHFAGIIHRLSS